MPEDCLQVRTKGTWRRRLLFSGGNIKGVQIETCTPFYNGLTDEVYIAFSCSALEAAQGPWR